MYFVWCESIKLSWTDYYNLCFSEIISVVNFPWRSNISSDVVQNSNIFERVEVLEQEMNEVQVDLTDVQNDVVDLEDEVAEVEDQVAYLLDEDTIQDVRIFALEQNTAGMLNSM